MQEDLTTNLTLMDPKSAGSISQNIQISPQNSRPVTLAASTNEVAIWALQLYIVPFAKTSILHSGSFERPFYDLSSAMRPGSHHLHSHSTRATIHPRPPGSIFLIL
jgi:hypothetical protein